MATRPVHRDLDRIARELLAPLLSGEALEPGWRLTGWDVEQALSLTFENGPACLLVELEARNEALDCYARTGRFNVCVRAQFADTPIDDGQRAFVDRVIAVVRARESALPDPPRPPAPPGPQVREVLVDRLLMPEGRDRYYVNPYVGCMIACPYCYVVDRADFSRRLEGLPELPWGRALDVKVNAAEVLRREVQAVRSGVVRMSPIITDPYQPAERRYRVTRQVLEVLADTALVPVVLTRAARVLEDLELLRRFPRALVGFSVPTDDDRVRRVFEPGADPIEARVEALGALHAAGVRTFAVVQPVLPMTPDRLVALLAPVVRAVRLDRLYLGDRVGHLYRQHGLTAFGTERYVVETLARLRRGFEARGVRVDPLDDFGPLLAD